MGLRPQKAVPRRSDPTVHQEPHAQLGGTAGTEFGIHHPGCCGGEVIGRVECDGFALGYCRLVAVFGDTTLATTGCSCLAEASRSARNSLRCMHRDPTRSRDVGLVCENDRGSPLGTGFDTRWLLDLHKPIREPNLLCTRAVVAGAVQ